MQAPHRLGESLLNIRTQARSGHIPNCRMKRFYRCCSFVIPAILVLTCLLLLQTQTAQAQVFQAYYVPTPASLEAAPYIPDSITVGYGTCTPSDGIVTACDFYKTVNFDEYLKRVVTNEMSALWGTFNPDGTGEAEGMNVLRAQAVAARSFAMNYILQNQGEDGQADGFICYDTRCQKYGNPDSDYTDEGRLYTDPIYAPARQSVDETQGFVLTNPEGGGPAQAFFAANTNNLLGFVDPPSQYCSEGDGYSGDPGFGYPCFADADTGTSGTLVYPNLTSPRNGHGAGMSQTGALRWAIGRRWNPQGYPYSMPAPYTGYADPNDLGAAIPNIITKDWKAILAHY